MRINLLRVNNKRKETGWKANNILYLYSRKKTVQLQTLLWFSSERRNEMSISFSTNSIKHEQAISVETSFTWSGSSLIG